MDEAVVGLLTRILDSRSGKIPGSVLQSNFGPTGQKLLDAGLLIKVGQTDVVASMDEHEDEPTRVTWCKIREGYGYIGRAGHWVEVGPSELDIYAVRLDVLFARMLVNCRWRLSGAAAPLIADLLWDLGTVQLSLRSKPLSLWFARRLFDPERFRHVEAIAAKRPPADTRVLLTCSGGREDLQASGHILVSLQDVRTCAGSLAVDPDILAKRLALLPGSCLKPLRHSPDYGTLYIGEEVYKFRGVQHRAILKILVDAYNAHDPVRLTADVLEEVKAGDRVSNMARAFSGNKIWHKFIKEHAGQCWIEF